MDRITLYAVVQTLPPGATMELTFAKGGGTAVPNEAYESLLHLKDMIGNSIIKLVDTDDYFLALLPIINSRDYGSDDNRVFIVSPTNNFDEEGFVDQLYTGLEKVIVDLRTTTKA